jgi:ribosome-associated protein
MSEAAMALEDVRRIVVDALEDMKAENPVVLDVRGRTTITDLMVFASGTSRRHVKSLADNVIEKAREAGLKPLGVEGEDGAEWILVDLGYAVVHIMMPEVRDFYRLESIWDVHESDEETTGAETGV